MKNLDRETNLFDKFEKYKVGDLSMFTGGEKVDTHASPSSGVTDWLDYSCSTGTQTCNGEPCDYGTVEAADTSEPIGSSLIPTSMMNMITGEEVMALMESE